MKNNPFPALAVIASIAILFVIALVSGGNNKISVQIVDVSWPNCGQNLSTYKSGIVGVTGGLDFHENKCLAKEVSNFNSYSLYMNTGYPGPNYKKYEQQSPLPCTTGNELCQAFNYGYNAANYAINYADSQNAHSRFWWLDVETENSWTSESFINRASLYGQVYAIESKVFLPQVGYYSYPGQWDLITGSWRNGQPAWAASGGFKVKDAVAACKAKPFTGGASWLGQYTGHIDINVPCTSDFTSMLSMQSVSK